MSSTLLIVEDDDRLRDTLALEFRERGYEVVSATNLEEVKALGQREIHYAAVDLRLCGEFGLPVVEHIHQRHPTCRTVVITGYGSIATAVDAVKKGASGYLTKPISIQALEAALKDERAPETTSDEEHEGPSLARHEREFIEYVLLEAGGNISKAARRLGIHRQSLQRKLKKFTPLH